MIWEVVILLATVVEIGDLAETALAALVAGVGVTFSFSTGIYGLARYGDLRREGRDGVALLAGSLAAAGIVASVAAVVVGIVVMVSG